MDVKGVINSTSIAEGDLEVEDRQVLADYIVL
jgi:hypothetical protein